MNESSRKVAHASRPCLKTLMALAVPVKTRESTTTMTAQEKFLNVPIIITYGEARRATRCRFDSFSKGAFARVTKPNRIAFAELSLLTNNIPWQSLAHRHCRPLE